MHITHVMDEVRLHVRTCTSHVHFCSRLPYLGNGWTDYNETWCVVRDSLGALQDIRVGTPARAHVHPPFRISGTVTRIAVKFGAWLGDHYYALRKSGWVRLQVRK